MWRTSFDLDALRSFVCGIELGSFAKAAERLGRSTSAVSAQLKKLEEAAGTAILQKSGRGLVLTPTGEIMLGYARRLLALNDEAFDAVRATNLAGWVRIGMQEDFGETVLTQVLGAFSRAHPQVRIEVRVARNAELLQLTRTGQLDLALAWDSGEEMPYSRLLGMLQLHWVSNGQLGLEPAAAEPLPLVAFDAPCLMRSAGTAALDRAGLPWRIAFTSLSLSGIWAAVAAGLGVTIRTRAGLPDYLTIQEHLPQLPRIGLVLHQAEPKPTAVVQRLTEIVEQEVDTLLRT